MTTKNSDFERLREEAASCRACPLWKNATQTVFGEGPKHTPIMLVGEQPGDKEDLAGKPFVGPAGKMLDRALEEAGVDRNKSIVTSCGSGVSAGVLTLALYRLGVTDTALYDGSWSEWGQEGGPAIATGPA